MIAIGSSKKNHLAKINKIINGDSKKAWRGEKRRKRTMNRHADDVKVDLKA